MNLFEDLGVPDEKLHPQFRTLRDSPCYGPARGMLSEIQQEFQDPDGNFVEQFQTAGFDPRTFEIFLYAFFRSEGHVIDRAHPRPDFLITKNGITAAIEAVTASPPSNEGLKPYNPFPFGLAPGHGENYLRHTLPVRLGSPLFSKLKQKYWKLPHVANRPFVIAIQDFHAEGSLLVSSTPLANYLFGSETKWYRDEDGHLVISQSELDTHRAHKEIPSGFFRQPNTEHVSAVLFCNSGTIPKFNRIGQQGRHKSDAVRMLRYGTCYRHDPDAVKPNGYLYDVDDPAGHKETWSEGTVLIQNPHALHPLPAEWLGAGAEEAILDGNHVMTWKEPFLPYSSLTRTYPAGYPDQLIDQEATALIEALVTAYPP